MADLEEVYRIYSNCKLSIKEIAELTNLNLDILIAVCDMPEERGKLALLRLNGRQLNRLYNVCLIYQFAKQAECYQEKKRGAKRGNKNAKGPQKKAAHIVVNNPRCKKEVV